MLVMKVWMDIEHLTGKMVVQLPIQIGLITMVIMVAIMVVMAGEVMVMGMDKELGRMKKKTIGMMEAMIRKKKDIIQQEMKLRKTLKCLLNLSQNG